MMDSFINYIYAILFFGIFSVILEMLLPKSNNSKYVKLVIGFALTFIIISPITKVFGNIGNLGNILKDNVSKIDNLYDETIPTFDKQTYIENIFADGIKTDVQKRIESYGYTCNDIDVKYNKNENNEFTDITYISAKITGKKNNKDNIENIDNIDINIGNEKINNYLEEFKMSENEKNEIIKNIAARYEIDKSKIHII